MNKKTCCALVVIAASLSASGAAVANSVSYYLDKSNATSLFPDGTDYLQVTIDDLGLANDKIYLTVTPLSPLTSIARRNFGIDKFSFNGPTLAQADIALTGWSLRNYKTVSIFGKFNNLLRGGGHRRSNPLTFSIDAANDTVASYAAALSNGSAFFAAHVAGFKIGCSTDGSDDEEEKKPLGKRYISSARHSSSKWFRGRDGECTTSAYFGGSTLLVPPTSTVPVPSAAWLFASGLVGMIGVSRRRSEKRSIVC